MYMYMYVCMWELNMFDIWKRLPCDMRLVGPHVVGSLMLIQRLRVDDQSTSSFEDEVLGVTPHHDYPPSHGSGRSSMSSHSLPHASPNEPFTNLPMPFIFPPPASPLASIATPSIELPLPPLPPYPLHVSHASSSTDFPPHPSHVAPVQSSTDPPPPLNMCINRPFISCSRGTDASGSS